MIFKYIIYSIFAIIILLCYFYAIEAQSRDLNDINNEKLVEMLTCIGDAGKNHENKTIENVYEHCSQQVYNTPNIPPNTFS